MKSAIESADKTDNGKPVWRLTKSGNLEINYGSCPR